MDIKQDPKPEGSQDNADSVKVFDPHRWLLDFEQERPLKKASPSGPVKKRTRDEVMMWNLVSVVLDLMFMGIITLLTFWGISQLLETSIKGAVFTLWQISQAGSVLLMISLMWIYHVAIPALATYTPGQWACQITRTPETISFRWVVRSTLRIMALSLTGFIMLPLFSWASGHDLEAQLTGLKLYTKN
jgi:hypothetical protein